MQPDAGTLTVREATPADARGIAEAHVRGWQVGYAGIIEADFLASLCIEERELIWVQTLEATDLKHRVLVAEFPDRLAGWVSYGPSRDTDSLPGEGEVQGLYVHPDFWHRGAGAVLMRYALDDLRTQGFHCISLWVLKGNERGIRFYQKWGFQADGTEQALTGRFTGTHLRMRKSEPQT